MTFRRSWLSAAFTLIELLLVIAIIGILSALLLGPASRALKKARDADWADKSELKIERLVKQLRAHYQKAEVTDAFSPRQLADANIIDGSTLQFLLDARVAYFPFVSSDPDDMTILRVHLPPNFLLGGYTRNVTKDQITKD